MSGMDVAGNTMLALSVAMMKLNSTSVRVGVKQHAESGANMKNSKWREYSRGVNVAEQLAAIGRARRNEASLPPVREVWRCGWCPTFNPIGAAVCEHCNMPNPALIEESPPGSVC